MRRKDERDSSAEGCLMGKDKEEGRQHEERDLAHKKIVICLTKEKSDS